MDPSGESHRLKENAFHRHAAFASDPKLKIAISGSTGLVGSALIPFLLAGGHQVVRLMRGEDHTAADGTSSVPWDPAQGKLAPDDLEGVDAVINLAGAGIADKRWTQERKKVILSSRVDATTLLARTVSAMRSPPRVFFSASAIGYYPSESDSELTESHPAGTGFLAEVCQAWEAATVPAQQAGIRTVLGRISVVLSSRGGALRAQLPLFRWWLGGKLGSGRQYVPWIEIGDLIGAIHFCLMNENMAGPINLTAPGLVTNEEFTKTLGRVLGKPTLFPAPAWALRLALGEMADGLLLPSQRVVPKKLQSADFVFDYPDLEGALRHQLEK